ncbi:hypothetical protein CEP52_015745 [Fusarium oligoseptatum]|uniref:Uncharacterized protein n=1 Tax=Fusarium oligoseptatum TaxID=2604345 RepID=A0A428SA62_9HYPO|nr:hypothetical protein CEP52_015745 [Fusarium oligoseptatum]
MSKWRLAAESKSGIPKPWHSGANGLRNVIRYDAYAIGSSLRGHFKFFSSRRTGISGRNISAPAGRFSDRGFSCTTSATSIK